MKKVIVFLLIVCLLFGVLLNSLSGLTGSDSLTVRFRENMEALIKAFVPCVILLGGIYIVIRSVLM